MEGGLLMFVDRVKSRVFGSIEVKVWHDKPVFFIKADPHVMLRIKRIFPKCTQELARSISLSVNPENCFELQWVLERFPMILSSETSGRLAAGSSCFVDKCASLNQLIDPDYEPPVFEMAIPARQYQRRGASILLENRFLILGDDVGLGKTCSAICTFTDQNTLPALVVTMAHLPPQWKREIKKFMPGLNVHIITKGSPYELPKLDGRGPDVLISSYHKLAGWQSVMAEYCRSVTFDECQELRRTESQKYQAAKNIAVEMDYALGLSATPVYNYGGEIFNIVDCLKTDAMGTRGEFNKEWCTNKDHIRDPKALGAYLREHFIMIRRTRADVSRELPAMTKIIETVNYDSKPLDDVQSDAAELARIVVGDVDVKGFDQLKASQELSWKLRQATGIAKARYVASFVRMLVEGGDPVVLYGWHRAVYEIWSEQLEDLGVSFYTGSESTSKKSKSFDAFNEGRSKVLIISLRSGAGLDGLQNTCKTVVIGELDWSPAVIEQNIGRVHRDGQTEPVMVWYLVSDAGSDPVVAETLGIKRDQSDGIRSPDLEIKDNLETDGKRVKHLASEYLKSLGTKRKKRTPYKCGVRLKSVNGVKV